MSSIKKFVLPLLLFFCVFVIYVHNLSRATYGGDVGDLLAAASIMGVPHPSGYPLFTLIGFLLSRINLMTPAFMIGLISAFSGALGAFFFYLISYKFTKSKIISLISVLVLVFSYYYWFYSEIAEVFALNNLFAIVLLLLAITYYQSKQRKYLLLLSFFAGLSLTNHQTIVLIFPSVVLLSFKNLFRDKQKIQTVLLCGGVFLVGLLPYLYIPLAASHNPAVNWDQVHDLSSFLRLVLRRDYGTLSIGSVGSSSLAERLVTLRQYLFAMAIQATLPVITLVLLGMFYAYKKYRQISFALFLALLLSGPVFLLYAGFSISSTFLLGVYERFVVLSFVVLLLFLPFGLLFVKNLLGKFFKNRKLPLVIITAFLIIPIFLFRYNYPKTDLSNLRLGETFIYDILLPLPKNSVIFLDGDTVIFNTWYLQFAEHFRPDIKAINVNGPAINSKFYQDEINKYYKAHPKEQRSQGTNINILTQIAKTRNVFSSVSMQPVKNAPFSWVPYGLSYKLLFKQDLPSEQEYIKQTEIIWEKLQVPAEKRSLAEGNLTISDIYGYYVQGLLRTGQYFANTYKDNNKALEYYKKAVAVDPESYSSYQILGSYYVLSGDCSLAEANLRKALEIAPYQGLVYFLLYYDYRSCFKLSEKANQVVLDYQKNFHSDFFQDLKKIQDSPSIKVND